MSKPAEAALATVLWIAVFFGGMALAAQADGTWMAVAVGGLIGLMMTIAGGLFRRYNAFGMYHDE